jgi:uncharacterized coiled-coil protein SlyX
MTDNAELVKRLRAPHYWISGSSEGHEGENDVPGLAADRIEALTARVNTQIPALKQVVAEREARIRELEIDLAMVAGKLLELQQPPEARIAVIEEENARLRDACIVANDFLVEGSSAQEFVSAALNTNPERKPMTFPKYILTNDVNRAKQRVRTLGRNIPIINRTEQFMGLEIKESDVEWIVNPDWDFPLDFYETFQFRCLNTSAALNTKPE